MEFDSKVKLINSAKAHFSTTPSFHSPGGEDPAKITKEEFLEMKKTGELKKYCQITRFSRHKLTVLLDLEFTFIRVKEVLVVTSLFVYFRVQ